MLLTSHDRKFLRRVNWLKGYLLAMAIVLFIYLAFTPRVETTLLAAILCGVFWLTQRLLSLITVLDRELTYLVQTAIASCGVHTVSYSLPNYKLPEHLGLHQNDRRFLEAVSRLKGYLLLMAASVFIYLLFIQEEGEQLEIIMFSVTLCAIFWLTQRLLSCITVLDHELMRMANAVKNSSSGEGSVRRLRCH